MNHTEKLEEYLSFSFSIADINDIPQQYLEYILLIGEQAYKQKGVYTVLVSLLTHKSLFPKQDIRKHQSSMPGGFSGRTIDTLYITAKLIKLGLPSMAYTLAPQVFITTTVRFHSDYQENKQQAKKSIFKYN